MGAEGRRAGCPTGRALWISGWGGEPAARRVTRRAKMWAGGRQAGTPPAAPEVLPKGPPALPLPLPLLIHSLPLPSHSPHWLQFLRRQEEIQHALERCGDDMEAMAQLLGEGGWEQVWCMGGGVG